MCAQVRMLLRDQRNPHMDSPREPRADLPDLYWWTTWTFDEMGKWTPFQLFQCFTNCLLSVDTWIL